MARRTRTSRKPKLLPENWRSRHSFGKLEMAALLSAARNVSYPVPPRPAPEHVFRNVLLCVRNRDQDISEISVDDTLEDLNWVDLGLAVLADRLDVSFSAWRIDIAAAELKVKMTVGALFKLVWNKILVATS